MSDDTLQQAYAECLLQANAHYENFPTASRLLPLELRKATAAIYSFARRADDFADEGTIDNGIRHQLLDTFSANLQQIQNGNIPADATFVALADVITRYQLPIEVFERLLTAFHMDIDKKRYASFHELMEYCHCSADPVGELVLRLQKFDNQENIHLSNRICSALQLINFIQDIDEDYQQRNRIYIPQDELQQYGVSETQFAQRVQDTALLRLVNYQIRRAKGMLMEGTPLIDKVHGRLRWILKITLQSALQIINKLEKRQDVFFRPYLKKHDWPIILLRSLYFRPADKHASIGISDKSL